MTPASPLADLSTEELRVCLGRGFRLARVMAELTQTEAARQLGVSNVHLCNVERGHAFPSFPLLAKAAALYRIDPWEIAGRQQLYVEKDG